ncbi:hypothetical protein [Streptomyces syringium]|uniref:hypothetical protein n=1 Tax=Streptomyces syringium TaxID=76729 RepID=UPI003455FFB6
MDTHKDIHTAVVTVLGVGLDGRSFPATTMAVGNPWTEHDHSACCGWPAWSAPALEDPP